MEKSYTPMFRGTWRKSPLLKQCLLQIGYKLLDTFQIVHRKNELFLTIDQIKDCGDDNPYSIVMMVSPRLHLM